MRSIIVSSLTLAAVLALSACSKAEDSAAISTDAATEGAAAAADASSATREEAAGPDIGGIVAPGVAFTYDYAFTLPAKAISGVQREHAAACERLGVTRCRVTGMRYEQPGEDRVEVLFHEGVSAIAPGQAAVFYEGDDVIGGGWIMKSFRQSDAWQEDKASAGASQQTTALVSAV